jgi:hypothetical protein
MITEYIPLFLIAIALGLTAIAFAGLHVWSNAKSPIGAVFAVVYQQCCFLGSFLFWVISYYNVKNGASALEIVGTWIVMLFVCACIFVWIFIKFPAKNKQS